MMFPDDGHPDLAANVLDLTGDARDEIVAVEPAAGLDLHAGPAVHGQADLRARAQPGLQRVELSHQRLRTALGGSCRAVNGRR